MEKKEKKRNPTNIMKIYIIFILALISSNVFSSDYMTKIIKCDSGAVNGQVKTWSYNDKEVFEIYTNGYKRKYKVESINKYDIFAYENTKRGRYNVYIGRSKVSVTTPLVSYTDINCKETN